MGEAAFDEYLPDDQIEPIFDIERFKTLLVSLQLRLHARLIDLLSFEMQEAALNAAANMSLECSCLWTPFDKVPASYEELEKSETRLVLPLTEFFDFGENFTRIKTTVIERYSDWRPNGLIAELHVGVVHRTREKQLISVGALSTWYTLEAMQLDVSRVFGDYVEIIRDEIARIVELELDKTEEFKRIKQNVVQKYNIQNKLLDENEIVQLGFMLPSWDEDRRDRESPIDFIRRVYREYLGCGLTRNHIRKIDPKLYRALYSWLRSNPLPPDFDLPTEKDQRDRAEKQKQKMGLLKSARVSERERKARQRRKI